MTEQSFVYIDCPGCGREVPKPIAVASVETLRHRTRGCRARIAVRVAPDGEVADLELLEPEESFEEAHDRLHPKHTTDVKRHAYLDAAMECAS